MNRLSVGRQLLITVIFTFREVDPESSLLSVIRQEEKCPVGDDKIIL